MSDTVSTDEDMIDLKDIHDRLDQIHAELRDAVHQDGLTETEYEAVCDAEKAVRSAVNALTGAPPKN